MAVSTSTRLLLAGVLLTAGWLKLADPAGSLRAVRAYELLPEPLVPLVAHGLPAVEVGLGLLLLAGLAVRTAAGTSAALVGVLLLAVVSAWARGLSIDCGCFGGGGEVAPEQTRYGVEVLRDLGLLAAAGWLAWRPRTALALERLGGAR